MDIFAILQSKPVLIGLHLGFGIIGIDAFLWLFGKLRGEKSGQKSLAVTAAVGTAGFVASWIAGGYYYVVYYGTLVKPVIKAGVAPWAHNIIMEAKEHIFLFVVPISVTVLFLTLLSEEEARQLKVKRFTVYLTVIVAGIGLFIGAMGFIISAAARWGAIN